jgi:hypothetical protein
MPAQDEDAAAAVSPHVFAALAASFQQLRARPVTSCALGAAVSFSTLSVCCGLGLFTTPFFICQLLALQLSAYSGRAIERGPAFVRAGGLLAIGMLMVGAVLVISLLGSATELSPTALSPGAVTAALLGSAAAWLLITPLSYAPIMLLEQPVSFELALAQSAHMTLRAGVLANARLAFVVFCLQHAPFVLAAWLVSVDDGRAALWVLCTAPLACVCVPLAQGMLVWSYTQSTQRPVAPLLLPDAQRRWVRVWALLIVLPIVSLVLMLLVLSKPSRIADLGHEQTPAGEVVRVFAPDAREQRTDLPASALTVTVTDQRVSVVASDGGGVGELPLSAAAPIERVRVVRVRDTFLIELSQAGRTYLTRIDRAGVRLDDDLTARLRDRSRPWQWLYLLWTLLFTVLLSVPVLADLAHAGAPPTAASVRAASPAQALRRALLLAILLLPWGLGCLAMALYSLFTA